jgi:hypothetical protein
MNAPPHFGFYPASMADWVFTFANDGLILPYWLCSLITATIAGAPWISFRFSLRTLLIATTLIAVVLGLIVWLKS